MKRVKNKSRNQLWQARKRLGLGQKQVAHLLAHKTTDQISRYENGQRMPGLKIVIQFEIIYGMPVRLLFRDYYEELRAEILGRARLGQMLKADDSAQTRLFSDFCSYEELLQAPRLTAVQRDRIRTHVVTLMRRYSDK